MSCRYVAVLMAACLMEQPAVRAIVAFSAGATLLYTPLFKRVTIIKNALVASVIALAVLGGAIAAGSVSAGVPLSIHVHVYVYLCSLPCTTRSLRRHFKRGVYEGVLHALLED